MINSWIQLLGMLLIIFVAAQLFTNGIEHFGERVRISEGATGSIFAAVATALPETIVPIMAILAGTPNHYVNEQISVGAILGAPLMLSTLSTFIMTISVIKPRGLRGKIKPERVGHTRDLNFFLIAFSFAALAMVVPSQIVDVRWFISVLLILFYIFYVGVIFKKSKTLVKDGHLTMTDSPLYFLKFRLPNNMFTILVQLMFGLALLLLGARGFVYAVESISVALNVSALVISLLLIPIATELPEKVNSIIWVRKNKDTLAFGNITGAMVFQGTLLPALGILLTPWQPSKDVLNGIFVTLIAAVWLRLIAFKNGIPIMALLMNGFLYLVYLYVTLGR